MGSDVYGHTCDKCPSRGSREVVGDFVPVRTWMPVERPQTSLTDDGCTSEGFERGIRYAAIGYPERCKKCNEKYARFKRAREAIRRLEYVRTSRTMSDEWLHGDSYAARAAPDAERWRYLRFITLTWPIKPTRDATPDLDAYMKRYVHARDVLARELDVLGGTDVMECVTTERGGGWFTHNVHFHGVWVMPWSPIEKISEAMDAAGVGRNQVRVIREAEYECRFTGETRTQPALNRSVAYLAKYLTKELMQGRRRIAWGAMRRWKEYVPNVFRCEHITTTFSVGRCECFQDENGRTG